MSSARAKSGNRAKSGTGPKNSNRAKYPNRRKSGSRTWMVVVGVAVVAVIAAIIAFAAAGGDDTSTSGSGSAAVRECLDPRDRSGRRRGHDAPALTAGPPTTTPSARPSRRLRERGSTGHT